MTHNLLEIFDQEIKPALFDELKKDNLAIDEVTYQHLTIIHASILGGLIDKAKKDKGAKTIKNLLEKGNHDGAIINQIPEIFESKERLSDTKKLGNSLLAFVFDEGTDKAFEKIQHFLSEKYQTTEEDLIEANRMIAPFSLGLIGRIVHDEELNEQQVAALLLENEPHIGSRFPGLAKVLGITYTPSSEPNQDAPKEAAPNANTEEKSTSQITEKEKPEPPKEPTNSTSLSDHRLFLKLVWPWLALFAVSALSLFLLQKFQSKPVESQPDNPFNFIQSDSLIQDNERSYTLPGNTILKVTKFSITDSLLMHLSQNEGQVNDTLRFVNPAIKFQDSSAVLTPSANKELAEILSVIRSYPTLKMDIQIYYDSTFQKQKPGVVNQQVKNLTNYFTAFGINSERVRVNRSSLKTQKLFTKQDSESEMEATPEDGDSIVLEAASQPALVSDKKVALLFYNAPENPADSLNIDE